jgi:signal transduction histidine kinase
MDHQVAARVERALRNTDRLARLIEDLLDVSRLKTGQLLLRPEDVDLVEMAREVLDRMREEATRAGCQLALEAAAPVPGRWDRQRLEQVLTNLVSNAIRYGGGQPIHVSVHLLDGSAEVRVRDGGPGIPPQDVERIFERFERAAAARHYGGLGLGLYICRQIVQAHGGSIFVEPHSPQAGATFVVRLPLLPPAQSPAVHVSGH